MSKKNRFERITALRLVGEAGLKIIQSKKVAISGLGALGSVVADMLARVGVGTLLLVDRDIVELQNLAVCSLYNKSDIGLPKAVQASFHLSNFASTIPLALDITSENIKNIKADLIIDATDNLETRFLLNEYARKNNLPWIYGTVLEAKGFVAPFHHDSSAPCLACFLPHPKNLASCESVGVFPPEVHMVAALQVHLGINFLIGKIPLTKLYNVNAQVPDISSFVLKRNPSCTVCSGIFKRLSSPPHQIISYCSSSLYQVRVEQDYAMLKKMLSKFKDYRDAGGGFFMRELIVFPDKRILIKCTSKKSAVALLEKYLAPSSIVE